MNVTDLATKIDRLSVADARIIEKLIDLTARVGAHPTTFGRFGVANVIINANAAYFWNSSPTIHWWDSNFPIAQQNVTFEATLDEYEHWIEKDGL